MSRGRGEAGPPQSRCSLHQRPHGSQGALPGRGVLHLFAALAEKERALISTRTRQALAAAKARGVSLGNPRLHVARESAVEAVTTEADRFAANVLPIIREAQKAGATSLREIAAALPVVSQRHAGANGMRNQSATSLSAHRGTTMRATTGSLLVALASVCAGCNLDRTGARRRRSMAHLAQRVKPGGP